jgi:hypothetical protein
MVPSHLHSADRQGGPSEKCSRLRLRLDDPQSRSIEENVIVGIELDYSRSWISTIVMPIGAIYHDSEMDRDRCHMSQCLCWVASRDLPEFISHSQILHLALARPPRLSCIGRRLRGSDTVMRFA